MRNNQILQIMKIKKIIFALATLLAIFACGDNDAPKEKNKNYVQLSVDGCTGGTSTMLESQDEPIVINILLANTLEQDAVLDFQLVGDDNQVLRLEGNPVRIKKGEKKAVLKIYSNKKGVLNKEQTISLKEKSFSLADLVLQKSWEILVKPSGAVSDLTADQLKLIKTYQEKYGLDLKPLLGQLDCEVKIKFPQGDEAFNDGGLKERVIKCKTFFTLSDQATAENPVLKMTNNPLGINDFLYEMLRKETTEDVQDAWWQEDNPQPSAIMKFLGYQRESDGKFNIRGKETFETELDGIVLNPQTKALDFISDKSEYSDPNTKIKAVNMKYKFSLWEKLLANKDKEIPVKNGTDDGGKAKFEMIKISDMLQQSGTLDPQRFLFVSDITSDNIGNEVSDWIKPEAKIDYAGKKMTFSFSFDHTNSSGYTQIYVTYTLH